MAVAERAALLEYLRPPPSDLEMAEAVGAVAVADCIRSGADALALYRVAHRLIFAVCQGRCLDDPAWRQLDRQIAAAWDKGPCGDLEAVRMWLEGARGLLKSVQGYHRHELCLRTLPGPLGKAQLLLEALSAAAYRILQRGLQAKSPQQPPVLAGSCRCSAPGGTT
jgi:hypothetical protein